MQTAPLTKMLPVHPLARPDHETAAAASGDAKTQAPSEVHRDCAAGRCDEFASSCGTAADNAWLRLTYCMAQGS